MVSGDGPKQSRRRTSLACVHKGSLLVVELRDPTTQKRFWSLPGGAIEPGERPIDAAVRETLEETGYAVVADPASEVVTRYEFFWDARQYDCETHWFTGYLAHEVPAVVNDAPYLLGCDWIPLNRLPILLADHPHIRDTTLTLLAPRSS